MSQNTPIFEERLVVVVANAIQVVKMTQKFCENRQKQTFAIVSSLFQKDEKALYFNVKVGYDEPRYGGFMNKKRWVLPLFLPLLLSSCGSSSSSSLSSSSAETESTSPLSTSADSGKTHVVVLAGQSNCAGNSYSQYLTKHYSVEKVREFSDGYGSVLINYDNENGGNTSEGAFVPVALGQGSETTKFGIEVGMAEYISKIYPDRFVYFIKFAVGGTALYDKWRSPSSGQTGELWTKMVQFVHDSFQQILRSEREPVLSAFCWMQGESDADDMRTPSYLDNLRFFVSDMRDEFSEYADEDGIGFVDAGISDSYVWKNFREINQAKQQFAKEDPQQNIYIDTISERLMYKFEPQGNPDPYHYDSDGEIELGRLFATALLENFLD